MVEKLEKTRWRIASGLSHEINRFRILPHARIRCGECGAERIIRGGDYFDNLVGSNYNKPIL